MIVSTYILIFFIAFLLAHKKLKKWINFVSIFTGIWCLFGILSTVGFYGLRVPNSMVHYYAWLFVSVVDFIFLLVAKVSDSNRIYFDENFPNEQSGGGIIQIVAILLSIPLMVKMLIVFLSTSSFTAIRQLYFSNEIFSSAIVDLVLRQLPIGLFEGLIVYYVYFLFRTKQFKYLRYAIFDAVIVTLLNGGRYAILLLMYSIVVLLTTNKKGKMAFVQKRKYNKKLLIILGAATIFMIGVTINRGQDFIKSFVTYFSGSFSFLDYIISSPSIFSLNDKLHGYLMFGAVLEPIVLLLKVLGLATIKVPQWHFNICCQSFYNIGTDGAVVYFNNNTSILYYFLRDFGWIGIIMGGVLLGFLIAKAYNGLRNGADFSQLMYMYLCNVMFNSVMTYQLFGMMPLFIIFVFYLSTRKTKIVLKLGDR